MAFNNFPYTDMHELNLDWIINKQKATAIEAHEALENSTEAINKVDNFIENLDLQDAVDQKMDEMYAAGDLDHIFDEYQKLTGDVIIVTASFGKEQPRGSSHETIVPFTIQCQDRIHTYTNRKCYYNAVGTKGFHDDGFLDVIRGLENEVTNKNTVTQILVAGGGNDITVNPDNPTGEVITTSDIIDGMQNFMTYVKATYPNAQVSFFWLSWLKTYQSWRPQRAIIDMIRTFKEICPRNGIAYCTNSEYVYHQYYDSWYLGDNYHPTTEASRYLADAVMDCLITGSCSVSREETIEANTFFHRVGAYEETNPVRDQVAWTIRQDNDITTISPNVRPCTPAFKLNFAAGFLPITELQVPPYFTYDSDLYMGFIPQDKVIKFPVQIMAAGENEAGTETYRTMFNGQGELYSGYGYIGAPRTDDYLGLDHYSELWFYIPTITIPTMFA